MELPVIVSAVSLVLFLAMSLPICVAMGLSVALALFVGDLPPEFMMQKMYMALDSFPLLAVPLFILSGEIMQKGTMANALLSFSRSLVGHIHGGMAHISVLTSLFYGALCGSAPATVAAVGGIMIPAMEKDNYPLRYATAVNTTAGCLGVLIPPSVPLIIYGTQANISISDLFIAGVGPGIFVGGLLIVMGYIVCRWKHYGNMQPKASAKERLRMLAKSGHALVVPVVVLGGIYGGVVTPTEAGAIAAIYALIVEVFLTKAIGLKGIYEVLWSTFISTATIFIIVAPATALGQLLLIYNTPDIVSNMLSGIIGNKYLLLSAIIIILLITGTFLDTIYNIVLLTPLFMPALTHDGVDPVHFGVIMITALAIGFLTPPVGVNLFVGCGISKLSIEELSASILPFLAILIGALFVIAFVPELSIGLVPVR
ncbi:MAG: TRAP transporter large permease [Mailhella sp.]|nr:TRAP transporter large permease [Mailhella sp.]